MPKFAICINTTSFVKKTNPDLTLKKAYRIIRESDFKIVIINDLNSIDIYPKINFEITDSLAANLLYGANND